MEIRHSQKSGWSLMNDSGIFFRVVKGLWYTLTRQQVFPMEIFRGKRVALVGAAATAVTENARGYIDGFDLVVRINKAPYVLSASSAPETLGHRMDILFHSFYENELTGGGRLDFNLSAAAKRM